MCRPPVRRGACSPLPPPRPPGPAGRAPGCRAVERTGSDGRRGRRGLGGVLGIGHRPTLLDAERICPGPSQSPGHQPSSLRGGPGANPPYAPVLGGRPPGVGPRSPASTRKHTWAAPGRACPDRPALLGVLTESKTNRRRSGSARALRLPSGCRPASGASACGGPPTPPLLWASAGLRGPLLQPPGGPAKPPAVRKGVRECPVGRGRRTLGGRRGLQASQCVRSPWHPDEAGTLPPPGGGVQAEGPWEEDEAGAAPIAQSSCPLEGRESSQDPGPQGATEPASQRAAGCWACRVQCGLCAPERRWGACGEPGSGAAGHRDPISRQLQ